MAGRDNHDKEMLRTLKRIATALEKIAQNTGPKNRTLEIDMEAISLDWNHRHPDLGEVLEKCMAENGNDERGEDK